MKKQLLVFLAMIIALPVFSQTPDRKEMIKNIRKGNSAYKEGKYEDADVWYRKAMEANPNVFDPIYNLANAEYKKDNVEAAKSFYSSVISNTEDKDKKASAYHNLGNTLLTEKKYKESIDAYKSALKLHPNDIETKTNLAYAQKKLEDEQQNQDQDKNQGGDQDKKDQDKKDDQNQDQQGDQDKKDDQKQGGDQDKKDDQDQQGNQDDKNDQNQDPKNGQGQQPQQPKISPQEAQQLLDAIQADERNTQDKVSKEKAKLVGKQSTEKNW